MKSTDPSCKFDPFKNERGFPSVIPRELIEKQKFSIEWAPSESTPREFTVTGGLLVVTVPPFFHPPLEYGDHIVSINNEPIKDREHFKKFMKQTCEAKHPTICFEVERVVSAKKLARNDALVIEVIPKETEPPTAEAPAVESCEYYAGVLVMFPKAQLGLGIKSLDKRVYIESTDNGFHSIGRRIFFIGDAILSVDGQICESVSKTSEFIRDALKNKRMARVVLERAIDPMAVNYVRNIVMSKQNIKIDPKMQDDVIALCKAQLRQMKKDAKDKPPPPVPILKEPGSNKTNNHVGFAKTSTEYAIGMDLHNPAHLARVPSRVPVLMPTSSEQQLAGAQPRKKKSVAQARKQASRKNVLPRKRPSQNQ